MAARPKFFYFHYHHRFPVSARSPIWKSPLALHRKGCPRDSRRQTLETVSYGAYFQAVRRFLEKDHYQSLMSAVWKQIGCGITPEGIKTIRVCLEKHGAFYHPARIDVSGNGFTTRFVLNVAISGAGRDRVRKEYHVLEKLNPILGQNDIPAVYARDEIRLRDGQKIGMFLGQWFEGYHEFHLSRDPQLNTLRIRVWDPGQGGIVLNRAQSREIYRQASRILTAGYNIETSEQIYYWHHAAGDFIVKLAPETIDVKLSTVRRYTPSIRDLAKEPEAILPALLIYFLNLTYRMRLDRIDGDGEMVWSDESAVEGAFLGFMEGLAQKSSVNVLQAPIDVCFIHYLGSCSHSDLLNISRTLVDTHLPQAAEVALIRRHLPAHVVTLRHVIRDFCSAGQF